MSPTNVETVQRLYELMTRGDDGLPELIGPDFVVDFSRRLVEPFVVRLDPDVLASLIDEARETWFRAADVGVRGADRRGRQGACLIKTSATGKASGVKVDVHVANVWTFRDGKPVELKYSGKVIHGEVHRSTDEALEAAGLAE